MAEILTSGRAIGICSKPTQGPASRLGRTINSSFAEMNFATIAKAIGVHGIRVEEPGAVGGAIEEALAAGRPTVVDVVTAFDGLYLPRRDLAAGAGVNVARASEAFDR